MTVLVSYQPRPIPLGPFCHTRIPVEDQKDGGLYKRGWSVISYLIPDKDKLLIRMLQLRVPLISKTVGKIGDCEQSRQEYLNNYGPGHLRNVLELL